MQLLAPNGKPSKLTAEQYRLARTSAFKKWFGDWENSPESASKVVDDNGEPLVVYHSTTKNFTKFKDSKYSNYIFFSNDIDHVEVYGDIVYHCFLSIKNPSSNLYPKQDLKENNQDGFINNYKEKRFFNEKTRVYCVIKSNQIKLADGTNTTFDSNNPDIRYKEGGEIKIKENVFKVKVYLAEHSYDSKTQKETPMWFAQVFKMNGKSVDGILTEDDDLEGSDIGNFDSQKKAKDFISKYGHKLNVILLDDRGDKVELFSNADIKYKEGGNLTDELSLVLRGVTNENKYKGNYKKIFDIIEKEIVFYSPYGTSHEEIKGNDFYITITPRPSNNIIEKISNLKNVKIINQKFKTGGATKAFTYTIGGL